MGSVYAARAANARRIGERLIAQLEQGYLVFTHEGEMLKREDVSLTGFGGNGGLTVQQVVYMDEDRECDNGMHMPIAEFDALFRDWRVVDPRHVKPFVPAASRGRV
ncbi:hypothetical protein [Bosea sp. RAC05]|uniref:hypothetical protein n=1 Tax=Bosea sp. RAC05 TaxID=1842539 RepID=UPI00083D522E|nr:hypothetical protein [Bosea sp. RAC05]AOG02887.1 hypothetical protein BSY19_4873 [Bosea sp. RAC05]